MTPHRTPWVTSLSLLALTAVISTSLAASSKSLQPPALDFSDFRGWKITATSTCGVEVDSHGNEYPIEEFYCLIDGAHEERNPEKNMDIQINGQFCSRCDPREPLTNHSAVFALDDSDNWWQSPPLSRGQKYREVNLTIDLGQELLVSYIYLTTANSPRPAVWVLEKSRDYGVTYSPWQYFATSLQQCEDVFNIDPIQKPIHDDSVICDTTQSKLIEPVKTGVKFDRDEIFIPLVKNRPSARYFYKSPVLQEWTKATNIRLRFLQPNTHKANLMSLATEDPSVTRRHFYSVKHISMFSYCVCNGHADTCLHKNPAKNNILACECQHNTCGDHCDSCCKGFVQKRWRPSTPDNTFVCEPCNCFGHSDECEYDLAVEKMRQSLDIHGKYEGGGVCKNCKHNTMGINCNHCKPGYYRPYNTPLNATDGCKSCKCDMRLHKPNFCRDGSGQCECKPQYTPPKCDSCITGYYGYPNCQRCKCDPKRTASSACDAKTGDCKCKPNFSGKMCDTCADGFYNFPYCHACKCNEKGAKSKVCDKFTGKCDCIALYGGAKCSKCKDGHFNFPKCTRCTCDLDGTEAEICNKKTGVCICREGYQGKMCDKCDDGRYKYPECSLCNCSINGSISKACDSFGNCSCRVNYRGRKCEQCNLGYYKYPDCLECKCHPLGAIGTSCDDHGKCMCKSDFGGMQCNECMEGYYGFPNCTACNCNPKGVIKDSIGCKQLPTGELCPCKKNVKGKVCDECKDNHWNLSAANPEGCEDCDCNIPGVAGHIGQCDPHTGKCPCKYLVESQRCHQCREGTYNLRADNLLGCSDCGCSVGGSVNASCDHSSGQCHCKPNIEGKKCSNPADGYYFPTLHQFQYEAEMGKMHNKEDVQFSFNETKFPAYSWKGYVDFSLVQGEITLSIDVQKSSKYKVIFHCFNLEEHPVLVTITVSQERTLTDHKRIFQVMLEPMTKPTFVTVIDPSQNLSSPMLMKNGEWLVKVKTESQLLLDYIVMIPLDYYEATDLRQSVNNPCTLEELNKGELSLCKHFCYPKVSQFHMAVEKPDSLKGRLHLRDCFDDEKALEDSVKLHSPLMESHNHSLKLRLELPKHGEYVLVIIYYTPASNTSEFVIDLESSSGRGKNHGKATLYSCHYSSLCREVFQDGGGAIKIFRFSRGEVNLSLSWVGDGFLDIISIVAIPLKKWSLNYIEPKPACIKVNGKCLSAPLDSYTHSKKIHLPSVLRHKKTKTLPYGVSDDRANLIHLDLKDEMVSLKGNSSAPGKYAFIIHYYQPDYPGFDLKVLVNNGKTYEAKVKAAHCPSNTGCYSSVEGVDGSKFFMLNDKFLFTLKKINHTTIWLKDLILVPEGRYEKSLGVAGEEINLPHVFTSHCIGEGYYIQKNSSEFCRDSLFTITTKFNSGPLPCECNIEGSENAHCEKFGGQCACKPNVIGRKCDQCRIGYYGFPECTPCDCPIGLLCNPTNGSCVCPQHTAGEKCEKCSPFSYGHNPYLGCKRCDCNELGVKGNQMQCDVLSGDCMCKENVDGRTCDHCSSGFSSFPDCTECSCSAAGTTEQICDKDTGKCICKKNVVGEACDVCDEGTFNLDEKNVDGCMPCFCFERSRNCSSSSLFRSQISDMQGWHVVEMISKNGLHNGDEVVLQNYEEEIEVHESGIQINFTSKDVSRKYVYFSAPPSYLGNKISSYKGVLNYSMNVKDLEFPGSSLVADVILNGADFYLFYHYPKNLMAGFNETISVELYEKNFQIENGTTSTKDLFMLALKNLKGLFIRIPNDKGSNLISLDNVLLETADLSSSSSDMRKALTVEQCDCPVNYKGLSCEECSPGYYHSSFGKYGGDCIPCECNGHADTCDPHTGVCVECKHNTTGDHCEKCGRGYYGNPSRGTPTDCQRCACPLALSTNNFAEECELMEDGVSIKCDCFPEYSGNRCEICAVGFFGKPDEGKVCEPCDCYGNINPTEHGSCDPVTGKCMKCLNNTYGDDCGQCAPGYFGDAIHEKSCQACECEMCGTDTCHGTTGDCECKEHVIGEKCDQCAPNHWNFSSCQGCTPCNCQSASESLQCDLLSGQCSCRIGVKGRACDQCAPGFWNYSSDGCQACECNEKYSFGEECDVRTGQCLCSFNLIGEKCDYCPERWILVPDEGCEECDLCIHTLLDDSDTSTVSRVLQDLRGLKDGYLANQKITFINETATELLPLVASFTLPRNNISTIVDDVISLKEGSSGLSRKTKFLSGKLKKLEQDEMNLNLEVMEAEMEIRKTVSQINETVMKTKSLTFHIIETDSKYIKEAQRILSNIEDIDFSEIKNLFANELIKCKKDLDNVKNLVRSADNQTSILKKMKNGVATLNDKLDDLKKESTKSEETLKKAMHLIGEMGIPRVTDKTSILMNLSNEANSVLTEAQLYLKNSTEIWNAIGSSNENLNIMKEKLTQMISIIENRTSSNEEGMKGLSEVVDSAKAHVIALIEKAEELGGLFSEIHNISEHAVQAANSYKNIVNAIKNAKKSADDAWSAGDEAYSLIQGRPNESLASKEKSSRLLWDAKDTINITQTVLMPTLKQCESEVNGIEALNDRNRDTLRSTHQTMKGVLPENTNSILLNALNTSENAINWTKEVLPKIKQIAEKTPEQLETAKGLREILLLAESNMTFTKSQERNATKNIHDIIASMESITTNQSMLGNDLRDLRNEINRLREKIDLARDRINNVDVGVRLVRDSILVLHNPPVLSQIQHSGKISLFFQTNETNGLLLFLGNENGTSSKSGAFKTDDYMALQIENGYPTLTIDLGSKPTKVELRKYVSNNNWYQIICQRSGRSAEFILREEVDRRGIRKVVTDSDSVVFMGPSSVLNLDQNLSRIIVGGYPEHYNIPREIENSYFVGNVEELKIDDHPVSFWNFIEAENINGTNQRHKLVTVPPTGMKFGHDSYAILKWTTNLWKHKSFIRFRFKTYAKDGLLFLAEKGSSFLSVELVNQKVVFRFNLGDSVTTLESARFYSDDNWHDVEAARDKKLAKLTVDGDDEVHGNSTGKAEYLVVSEYLYFGGYPGEHNLKSVSQKSFEGCIDGVELENVLDLSGSIKSFGITPGCPSEKSNIVSFIRGYDGFVCWSGIDVDDDSFQVFDLNFKFNTTQKDALLFFATDLNRTNTISLSLVNGILILNGPHAKMQISSSNQASSDTIMYNDGAWHSVTATYESNILTLEVDDYKRFQSERSDTSLKINKGDIYFGGVPAGFNNRTSPDISLVPLIGCIGDATFGSKLINFANASAIRNTVLGRCALTGNTFYKRPVAQSQSQLSYAPPDEGCSIPQETISDPKLVAENGYRFGTKHHSHLVFQKPPHLSGDKYKFSVEFNTDEKEGILLYIADDDHAKFIALYLHQGKIFCQLSCGKDIKRVKNNLTWNNGEWNTVTLMRNAQRARIKINDRYTGSIYSDCETSWMKDVSHYYVGGVPKDIKTFVNNNLGFHKGFSGCLRNYHDSTDGVFKHSIAHDLIPCSQEVEKGVFFSAEGGHIIVAENFTVGETMEIEMEVKPHRLSGILMYVQGPKRDFLALQMYEGSVLLNVDNGRGNFSTTFKPSNHSSYLCNGEWHTIRAIKNKNALYLIVDDNEVDYVIQPNVGHFTDTSSPLYLGGHSHMGIKKIGLKRKRQFVGCMRNVSVNGKLINMDEITIVRNVWMGVCPTA
ncbi:laminin subunit alpha-like [Ischnura elegans]|uniref:laminin subunit alpha-like n=1 Tax=Ischnura elegans TaxID=197161 RepID=UPI001ED89202|nr:laminin subunit alpha-like [Ischnura elegans]